MRFLITLIIKGENDFIGLQLRMYTCLTVYEPVDIVCILTFAILV